MIAAASALLVAIIAMRATAHTRSPMRTDTKVRHNTRPSRPDYATLLDAIARQVRSGSSLTNAAIDEMDHTSQLAVVQRELTAGSSLEHALAAIEPGDADTALTVQALSAAAHLGGPIAATLDEAAAVLRDRAAARDERRAQSSQARLSARILTIVPLAFAVWSAVASQRTRDVYTTTAAGGACALCGLGLNIVGWRWMKLIISPVRS
jgi:tight adherence protein B